MTTETTSRPTFLTRPAWRLGWYVSLGAVAAHSAYQLWQEQRLGYLPLLLAGAAPAYLVARIPGDFPGPWRFMLWLLWALFLTQAHGVSPVLAVGMAAATLLAGLFVRERRMTRTTVGSALTIVLLLGVVMGVVTQP